MYVIFLLFILRSNQMSCFHEHTYSFAFQCVRGLWVDLLYCTIRNFNFSKTFLSKSYFFSLHNPRCVWAVRFNANIIVLLPTHEFHYEQNRWQISSVYHLAAWWSQFLFFWKMNGFSALSTFSFSRFFFRKVIQRPSEMNLPIFLEIEQFTIIHSIFQSDHTYSDTVPFYIL